jgi:ribonuclease HI
VKKATVYIDGSGNSERIQCCACALFIENDGTAIERTKLLPRGTTNNVGEYSGAILAIQTAIDSGVTKLKILSDSKLIVHQIRGDWDCKNQQLRSLRDEVWALAANLEQIDIQWIPRGENRQADGLCRRAIRSAEKNTFLKSAFPKA